MQCFKRVQFPSSSLYPVEVSEYLLREPVNLHFVSVPQAHSTGIKSDHGMSFRDSRVQSVSISNSEMFSASRRLADKISFSADGQVGI